MALLLLLLAACIIAFILCAWGLLENRLAPFDNLTYRFIARLISPDLTQVMRFVSNLGSSYVIFILWAVLAAWGWWSKKHRLFGMVLTVNLVTAVLMSLFFKMIFHRERPNLLRLVNVSGYSFPSGHSMISAVFYGYLAYLCMILMKKPWKVLVPALLLLLIFLIGLSRIYLGVHYASDVAAGFSAGFSWVAVFIVLTRIYLDRR